MEIKGGIGMTQTVDLEVQRLGGDRIYRSENLREGGFPLRCSVWQGDDDDES